MTFHDFLWPFPVFQDLRLSCQFKKVKTFTCFGGFFDLKQFNRQTLAITKMLASLFFIVLALSTAVNNLSNKTLIFHDFQGSRIKFHDFPGLEMKFINSMTFHVFHDLYEPRVTGQAPVTLLKQWKGGGRGAACAISCHTVQNSRERLLYVRHAMLRSTSTCISDTCANVSTPLTSRGTQALFVVNYVKSHLTGFNNCIAKTEVGCLKHPGAYTIGSQLLDENRSHGWQILGTQS